MINFIRVNIIPDLSEVKPGDCPPLGEYAVKSRILLSANNAVSELADEVVLVRKCRDALPALPPKGWCDLTIRGDKLEAFRYCECEEFEPGLDDRIEKIVSYFEKTDSNVSTEQLSIPIIPIDSNIDATIEKFVAERKSKEL